ncbi:cell division protein FtsZ [Alloscardovia omnicolens]|uniref:cell division protein FtsZ n=1 Tax=Alloscardovia omnicolens TaxID=419015 RepID=UPI000665C8BC|nr:cell division protein FtsZ [Alloscardovia omnicolens]MDK6327776.1 cell division protein FtsZ [Alloscardovia omnicolens]MDK8073766.1 cell division protein FtsZ [Alloscardovia omnicolens]MDK8080701.1 cell division protein FtsZ [Alloscardovia omnicolens]
MTSIQHQEVNDSTVINNEELNDNTVIKVVGVGGAGGNAVNRMINDGLGNVEFLAINTDDKDLARSEANVKLSLNDSTSRGLGAGADPERGAKAAQDHRDDIEQALKGADLVFITAGEGGGTGTGASPIVAKAARQQGALTVAVVSRPFTFEGRRRSASAESGIENLRKEVDALIVISNDRLLDNADRQISMVDAFHNADQALLSGVKGITETLNADSYINVDFADISSVLKDAGTALFGIGKARGENRATNAAELALNSPMLEGDIQGAHAVLVNFFAASDLGMLELNDAMNLIHDVCSPEANIIFGVALDDSIGDELQVTVIATGFGTAEPGDEAEAPVAEKLLSTPAPAAAPTVQPRTPEQSASAETPAPVQQAAPAQAVPAAEPAQPVSAAIPSVTENSGDEGDSFDDLEIPEFLR